MASSNHGGKRVGAGRKPVKDPKQRKLNFLGQSASTPSCLDSPTRPDDEFVAQVTEPITEDSSVYNETIENESVSSTPPLMDGIQDVESEDDATDEDESLNWYASTAVNAIYLKSIKVQFKYHKFNL